MPLDLENKLVVGISSRALFDLEEENRIYETEGLQAYAAYQRAHENDVLKPGTAFPLIKALHNLNGDDHLMDALRYAMEDITYFRPTPPAPPPRRRYDGIRAEDMHGVWE